MMAALKAKGIKFSNAATDEKLKTLLGIDETGEQPLETEKPAEPEAQSSNQLVDILTSLSKGLEMVNSRLDKLEQPVQVAAPQVFSIGAKTVEPNPVQIEQSGDMFLTQVPVSLRKAAEEILGPKFSFECQACPDRPAFAFTVIVPQEYSKVEGQDRRTRIIDNALGANGVRDWCLKVKQNVIQYLGNNIATVSL